MPFKWSSRRELPVHLGGTRGDPIQDRGTSSWPRYEAEYLKNRLDIGRRQVAGPTDMYSPQSDPWGARKTGGLSGPVAKLPRGSAAEQVYLDKISRNYRQEAEEQLKQEFNLWLEGKHVANKEGGTPYANGDGKARRVYTVRNDTTDSNDLVSIGDTKNNWRHTPWGKKQLTHLKGVREYLRGQAEKSSKAEEYLNILAEFGPQNIDQAWLYFKHWVKGMPSSDVVVPDTNQGRVPELEKHYNTGEIGIRSAAFDNQPTKGTDAFEDQRRVEWHGGMSRQPDGEPYTPPSPPVLQPPSPYYNHRHNPYYGPQMTWDDGKFYATSDGGWHDPRDARRGAVAQERAESRRQYREKQQQARERYEQQQQALPRQHGWDGRPHAGRAPGGWVTRFDGNDDSFNTVDDGSGVMQGGAGGAGPPPTPAGSSDPPRTPSPAATEAAATEAGEETDAEDMDTAAPETEAESDEEEEWSDEDTTIDRDLMAPLMERMQAALRAAEARRAAAVRLQAVARGTKARAAAAAEVAAAEAAAAEAAAAARKLKKRQAGEGNLDRSRQRVDVARKRTYLDGEPTGKKMRVAAARSVEKA